jgi:thiosulfate/3-mercaptopyruvate sulfurtransferase
MRNKRWYFLIFALVPALVGLGAAPTPAAAAAVPPLVTTDWLEKNLDNPGLVVIDVRTEANYDFAHIPGAISSPYMGWEPVNEKRQCQLMPSAEDFTKMMRDLGLNDSSYVIIYDHGNTESDATKGGAAVWILESMGHSKVSYLNGGFTKWTFEGRLIDKKIPTPKPGNFTAKRDPSKVATLKDVTDNLKTKEWLLLDDRNALQYFGTVKHANATRYGHVPGALCWPAAFMTNAGANRAPATMKSKQDLEKMARGVGIPTDKNTKIITFCNSGQQAGMAYFVLHDLLGYKNVKAYDGSIIEYSAIESLPLVKYSWEPEAK